MITTALVRGWIEKAGGNVQEERLRDYKWINPKSIVVGQWVRMKCMFGCKNYGQCGICPPNVPSVPECEAFFEDTRVGLSFTFLKSGPAEDRHAGQRGQQEASGTGA